MNWSGAKNHVYSRVSSLMLLRMEHDKNGMQKPVNNSPDGRMDIRNLEFLTIGSRCD